MPRKRKSGYTKEQEQEIEVALQQLIIGATNYGSIRANTQAEPPDINRARLQADDAIDNWYKTVAKIQAECVPQQA